MSYTKAHKFMLRSIASRGALTALEAQNVLRSYAEDTELSIPDLIRDINEEIRPFQQTIKTVTDELTNEEVHVFLSLGFDEATKAQNFFTANELEFFRLLIEEIMSTETRQVTGIHAINLVGKMKGTFTKTDAQKLLKTWCNMHYLDKGDGKYALGVRAIHEFESYLREHMPDAIEECCLCKQIVFRGCNCPACSLAVHTRCLNKYLEKIQKWPCCKYDYDANQLERLQADRLSPTQRISMEQSEANDTINEPAAEEILTEDMDLTQNTDPGVSQCVSRKRKRQME